MRREQGLTYEKIGKRLGMSSMTVRKWVLAEGQPSPSSKRTDAKTRETTVKRILDDELSYAEAAKELGVQEGTVRLWLSTYKRQHGLATTQRKTPAKNPDLQAWGREYRERRLKELAALQRPRPAEQQSSTTRPWPSDVRFVSQPGEYLIEERELRGETG
jgi:transposase-like protein